MSSSAVVRVSVPEQRVAELCNLTQLAACPLDQTLMDTVDK